MFLKWSFSDRWKKTRDASWLTATELLCPMLSKKKMVSIAGLINKLISLFYLSLCPM
jgi:hypothetical protein